MKPSRSPFVSLLFMLLALASPHLSWAIPLPTLPGYRVDEIVPPLGLLGTVSIVETASNGEVLCNVATPTGPRPFLVRNGTSVAINLASDVLSATGYKINAMGMVAGLATTTAFPARFRVFTATTAENSFRYVTTGNYSSTSIKALNDLGDVIFRPINSYMYDCWVVRLGDGTYSTPLLKAQNQSTDYLDGAGRCYERNVTAGITTFYTLDRAALFSPAWPHSSKRTSYCQLVPPLDQNYYITILGVTTDGYFYYRYGSSGNYRYFRQNAAVPYRRMNADGTWGPINTAGNTEIILPSSDRIYPAQFKDGHLYGRRVYSGQPDQLWVVQHLTTTTAYRGPGSPFQYLVSPLLAITQLSGAWSFTATIPFQNSSTNQIPLSDCLPPPSGSGPLTYTPNTAQVSTNGQMTLSVVGSTKKYLATPIADADQDRMPDAWETAEGTNPQGPSDFALDPDSDGLNNRQEFLTGTKPLLADTDGDGLNDGLEKTYHLNPRDPNDAALDYDDDQVSNADEILVLGHDPSIHQSVIITPFYDPPPPTPGSYLDSWLIDFDDDGTILGSSSWWDCGSMQDGSAWWLATCRFGQLSAVHRAPVVWEPGSYLYWFGGDSDARTAYQPYALSGSGRTLGLVSVWSSDDPWDFYDTLGGTNPSHEYFNLGNDINAWVGPANSNNVAVYCDQNGDYHLGTLPAASGWGVPYDLGQIALPPADSSPYLNPFALNNANQLLVGGSASGKVYLNHNNISVEVTHPEADSIQIRCLNDNGVVAGTFLKSSGQSGLFLWKQGGVSGQSTNPIIAERPGNFGDSIYAINNRNHILRTLYGTPVLELGAFTYPVASFGNTTLDTTWITFINNFDQFAGMAWDSNLGLEVPVVLELGIDNNFNGIPDDWEAFYFKDASYDPRTTDTDRDGIMDWDEFNVHHTTAGNSQDRDGDGLVKDQENDYGTDPTKADTDGDGQSDLAELLRGSDPLSASSIYASGTPENNEPRWEVQLKGVALNPYGTATPVHYLGWPWHFTVLGVPWYDYDVYFHIDHQPTAEEADQKLGALRWGRWERDDGPFAGYARWNSPQGSPPSMIGEHRRVRLARIQPVSHDETRSAFVVKQQAQPAGEELETTSFQLIEASIKKDTYASTPIDLMPHFQENTRVVESLLPVEIAPHVLAVNSNFDEGRIDSTTGYAIPDCEDSQRSILAERDQLDGRWALGAKVIEDMHQGWFGVKPSALGVDFWNGSTVTIRKIDKTDPDTDKPEPGEVRFYATDGVSNASDYQCIEPYDLTTHMAANLAAGGIYGAPGRSVYGANTDISSSAKFWIEGVKPGKITLEWRYVKGETDFRFDQTFLVATQQPKQKWLEEITYQLRLQSGDTIRLQDYLPANNVWEPNQLPAGFGGGDGGLFNEQRKNVAGIYDYYAQLFIQYPDQLDWMGAASQVGGAVYGGLQDMATPGTMGAMNRIARLTMGGQILIYRDLGWQHRAYVASGIPALSWVARNDPDSINGIVGQSALELNVWTDLDTAIRDEDHAGIKAASRRLVRREQEETIKPFWDQLDAWANHQSGPQHFARLFLNEASQKAKCAADPAGSNFAQVTLDGPTPGRIEKYRDRDRFSFGWVNPANPHSQKGVFPVWWGDTAGTFGTMTKMDRIIRCKIPTLTRATDFRELQ